MFNFLKSKKEILLSDMHDIYAGLYKAGESRKEYAKNWSEFAKYAKVMIMTQNSNVTAELDRFVDLCTKYAESQTRLAEAEMRNAEDFRDVAERFSVVYRGNNEYIDQKRKFRELEAELKEAKAKNEAESAKPTYAKVQAKLEANINRLKDAKKEAYELTKQRLRDLIDIRNKYNAFKIRRFCHGWSLLGTVLKQEGQTMTEILQKIGECLEALAACGAEGTEKLAEAVQEQVEAAPAADYAPSEPVESNPNFGGYD